MMTAMEVESVVATTSMREASVVLAAAVVIPLGSVKNLG